jgi:arylformamidase
MPDYYDITVPLFNELPTYPGDPGIQISDWRSLAKGDSANVSVASFGAHSGTHVDAPAHFIPGGEVVENLPFESLIGEALVVRVPDEVVVIDKEFVSRHVPLGTERVLFETRNSGFWSEIPLVFHTDFTHLDLGAATWLRDNGAKLIGIDYLSIERFKSGNHEVHLALLSHGVVILEGLFLWAVPAGKYELFCLPLRLRSDLGDGAPARAVLRTLD